MKTTTLLILLLLTSCQSAGLKPRKLDTEKFCDSEKMALPKTLSASGWVKVSDVRILEEANQKCGRHTIEIATHNMHAAEENKPDGFLKKSWIFLQGLLAGAVIGFGIGAGS